MNDSKGEKQMKKIIEEIVIKEKNGTLRNKNIHKSESKSKSRFGKELIFVNNNISKNVMINNPIKDTNCYIRNLKNQLISIDLIKSIDDSNKKKINKKPEKKLKFFSEVFQEKFANKNSLSIKSNPTSYVVGKTNATSKDIENNSYSKKTNIKEKVLAVNPKRYIKSYIFLENFKNYGEKINGKSITKASSQYGIINKFNSNSVDKFSMDTATILNSTKSNSFASSFSNSNTISNSLKHLNLKSHFSSNNTVESTLSNNSFIQTKDLKPKFNIINLEKTKTVSTCNVVISLNTNKTKNKTLSSVLGTENKKIIIEGKNQGISKNFKKK
jgi:hypothetical protein